MSNNKFLADYVYLAETSYVDFSREGTDFRKISDPKNGKKPESFAELVTNNYEVVAHYKDRVDGWWDSFFSKESGFSGTLFKNNNTNQYVLALKGTKELIQDLWVTDGGDIVLDGSAHHQIVDLYNFWQQITSPVGQYQTKQLVVVDDLTQKMKDLNLHLLVFHDDPLQVEALNAAIKDLYAEAQSKGYIVDIGRSQILKIEDKMSYEVYSDERKYGLGIKDIGSLVVSGHSLGGHLTAAFARLFPEMVEHAYMVNGAGFGRETSVLPKVVKLDAVQNVENLFNGLNQNNKPFDTNKITNIIGTGMKVVANDWAIGLQQPGQTADLFIETEIGDKLGHGSSQMSDSMMVASLFFAMDSSLNTRDIQAALNTLNPIFKAAHSDDAQTLEKLVYSLSLLFLGDNASQQASSRDELYQQIMNLINLKDTETNTPKLNGQYRIVSLAEENGWQQLAYQAEGSYATAIRYALKHLNPFAVAGVDYQALNHNLNGELDLHSPTHPNGMTEIYIQKRTEMLQALLLHHTKGHKTESTEYYDLSSNQTIQNPPSNNLLNIKKTDAQVIFGSDNDERKYELNGGLKDDYLFGGGGHDILRGDSGNDYLEGGAGHDILRGGGQNDTMNGGEGNDSYYVMHHDTIIDSDMVGKVFFDYGMDNKPIQAQNFAIVGENLWKSVNAAGQFEGELYAMREGNQLRIQNAGHSATIVDFFQASNRQTDTWQGLGITLEAQEINAILTHPSHGYGSQHRLLRFAYDYENTLAESATELAHERTRLSHARKQLGSHLDDMMLNTLNGSAVAFLGDGNDVAYGGYGYDWIYGESGNDILLGSSLAALNSRPQQYGQNGKEKNVPTGLLDRDYLVGGSGSDLIFGIDGDDIIYTDEDGTNGKTAGHLLPENKVLSALRGDLAAGGKGNDHIYGSVARDLLTGGAGRDTIFGGAGDDVLIGDGELFPDIKRSLQVSAEEIIMTNMRDTITNNTVWRVQHLPFDAQTDKVTDLRHQNNQNAWDFRIENGEYIYESAITKRFNEHRVKTGGDDDLLFGGEGNDLLIGQDGNDYLDGGAGNDILWGDDFQNLDDFQNHTNNHDILKGGKGTDYLYGGYGYDTYLLTKADLTHAQYDKKFIHDIDHQGVILMDGVALNSVHWQADKNAPTSHWFNTEKDWDLRLNGSDLIFSSPNKTAFVANVSIQNFQNHAFGLNLLTETNAPDYNNHHYSHSSPLSLNFNTGNEYAVL